MGGPHLGSMTSWLCLFSFLLFVTPFSENGSKVQYQEKCMVRTQEQLLWSLVVAGKRFVFGAKESRIKCTDCASQTKLLFPQCTPTYVSCHTLYILSQFTQVRRELTCDQGFRPVAIDLTALLPADQREM